MKRRFNDSWCEEADYFLVQEGADLTRVGRVGYHWTTPAAWERIKREGLGRWEVAKDHEVGLVYCLLSGKHRDVADRAGQTDAAVERALRAQYPKLRAAWFVYDEDYAGETATRGASVQVRLDLDGIGDWLAGLPGRAWCIVDNALDYAIGYGLVWNGPPIPPKFLSVVNPLLARPPKRINDLDVDSSMYEHFVKATGRAPTDEDYAGLHVTSDIELAAFYARGAARKHGTRNLIPGKEGDVPAIVHIYVTGLEGLPDVDTIAGAGDAKRSRNVRFLTDIKDHRVICVELATLVTVTYSFKEDGIGWGFVQNGIDAVIVWNRLFPEDGDKYYKGGVKGVIRDVQSYFRGADGFRPMEDAVRYPSVSDVLGLKKEAVQYHGTSLSIVKRAFPHWNLPDGPATKTIKHKKKGKGLPP